MIELVSKNEDYFIQSVMNQAEKDMKEDNKLKEKRQYKIVHRIEELDTIISRLYEDSVTGKMSVERFSQLTERFEQEQASLKEENEELQRELKESKEK
ncbi:hypothetical protein [Enterococcus larvae]|uniref:hypothetical protein n=1 Tax=Enterococcus larvae TaxID=2794352 RepID=UPI003F3295D3